MSSATATVAGKQRGSLCSSCPSRTMARISNTVMQLSSAPVTTPPMRHTEEDPMPATVAPVRLSPERVGEAAAVLGRAVVDDPLFVFLLPGGGPRVSGVFPMMEMFLRLGLAHGEVWVTPPPIAGVACWLSPAHPTVSQENRDAAGWREVGAAWGGE